MTDCEGDAHAIPLDAGLFPCTCPCGALTLYKVMDALYLQTNGAETAGWGWEVTEETVRGLMQPAGVTA